MRDVLAGYVERDEVCGLVALVARRNDVHVEVVGSLSAGGAPLQRDAIVRIASMTKQITAVAALILVEECHLRLDDPVDRWLPELSGRRVLRRPDAPLDDTVPAVRPISLRDLLTFTLGFGLLFAPPDGYPSLRAADAAQIGMGPPRPGTMPAPDEWLRRFSALPLIYQPGERWLYNTGSDLLGVLIARAAGQPFERFCRERIFEPLGMRDTAFSVPPGQIRRLATAYWIDPQSGERAVFDPAEGGQWSGPPAFPSGAGGLVSTADDYLAFARMLLGGGRLDGVRLLARPTVEAMVSDQLTAAQKAGVACSPATSSATAGASASPSRRAAAGRPPFRGATVGTAASARPGARTRTSRW